MRGEHFAGLVDDEYASVGAGTLLETNGSNEGEAGVAKKCVLKLLFGLESSVCLGGILGESIDIVTRGREGSVRVSESTDLGGT